MVHHPVKSSREERRRIKNLLSSPVMLGSTTHTSFAFCFGMGKNWILHKIDVVVATF
jgi:hypothetical protein